MNSRPLGRDGEGPRKQQQLCRSCVFPAQGCGRSTLPWVSIPTNLATLQELRLAVGVILNLMVSTNPFLPIILLRVTPSANRNTYSVATPYYIYTQGRGAARLNTWAMKSQLLQSCRGGVPSTIEAPSQHHQQKTSL